MAWIEEIEPEHAEGELAQLYGQLLEQRGKVANILKVHSLNPPALANHLDLYMTLLFGKSGLSRAEREAIAVVVSANNHCDYCVNHHAEALRRYIKDDHVLQRLMTASELHELEPRLAAITRHAGKLTATPNDVVPPDLALLKAQGLSDKDILDLTLVVGYFNFVNRIALGLGVSYSADELTGYNDEGA